MVGRRTTPGGDCGAEGGVRTARAIRAASCIRRIGVPPACLDAQPECDTRRPSPLPAYCVENPRRDSRCRRLRTCAVCRTFGFSTGPCAPARAKHSWRTSRTFAARPQDNRIAVINAAHLDAGLPLPAAGAARSSSTSSACRSRSVQRQRLRKLRPAGHAGACHRGQKGRRGYTSPVRGAARSTRRLQRFERVLQAPGFGRPPVVKDQS
jgi:hypothetical protein